MSWQDDVLHVATVKPGGSFCLGNGRGDFSVPVVALLGRRQPLVRHRRGIPHLVVPARARGSVSRADGRSQSFEELRPAGTFRSIFSEAIELPLEVGTKAQLELGELTVVVSRAATVVALPRLTGWTLDRRLTASLGGSALAMILLLVLARQVFPPLAGDAPWEEGPMPFATPSLFHVVPDVHVDDAEPPPIFMSAPGDTQLGGDHACRCHEPPMGHWEAPTKVGRYGVRGPLDNPDPHISRYLGSWGVPGYVFIGWLGPMPWARDTPTAPWGRDDALGQDPTSARGRTGDRAIAEARGAAGLGIRREGGVAKTIASTVTEDDSPRRPPRIFHTDLRTAGPLPAQTVLQVVAGSFPQLSRCYRHRLATLPELAGRVDVHFVVRAAGTVTQVVTSDSSLPDPELRACLLGTFDALTFPAQAAGPTRVRYPLILQPGTGPDPIALAALPAESAIAWARAAGR